MSPEQLVSAKHVTAGADLWSLAAVAYQALVGRPPFDGDSAGAIWAAIAKGTFAAPSQITRGLPSALDIWFRRALDVERINRFPSAREFAETFARAVALPAGLVVPARLPPRTLPRSNEGVPSAGVPSARSLATPSVLRRRECIHFVPPRNDAPPTLLAGGFTRNDADDRQLKPRGEEAPAGPRGRRT
jgi:serine/threonine protein kinase